MNILERAWLYVSRKRTRSLILCAILSVTAIALLIAQSMLSQNRDAVDRLQRSVNSTFTYTANPEEKQVIRESDAHELARLTGIAQSDLILETQATPAGLTLLKPANSTVEPGAPGYEASTQTIGTSNSALGEQFASGTLQVTEGRHISGSDRGTALIHKTLAEHNGLSIGQKFTLRGSNGKPQTFEIIGLFTGQSENNAFRAADLVENRIFADVGSVQALAQLEGMLSSATYKVAADAAYNEVFEQARTFAAEHKQIVEENSNNYGGVLGIMENTQSIMKSVLLALSILSMAVLMLVLFFWIQERMHETGVMMSIGMSKGGILLQYIVEALIIAVASFIPIALIASAFAQVRAGDVSQTFLMLTSIIVISIIGATLGALRLKPREILSKLS